MLYVLLISLAFAQDSDRSVKYQNRTEIDFEALDITGEMIKPQGALIIERHDATFNPLIQIRTDWNAEIADSVRAIK